MDFIQSLNKEQMYAVTHDVGPVFVIAGAGTGKTRTLTMRIAYLIATGYNPKNILAVTFTNKAAKEMKSRVVDMIGPSGSEVWMYTFHAFGLQILRRHIGLLPYGYMSNFNVVDEDDVKRIIKECILSLEYPLKNYSIKHLRSMISMFKNKRIDAFDFDDELKIFFAYQNYLRTQNLVDFDDLLLYTQELFKTKEDVLSYYQMYFEHIHVDEFQDTDKIQYDIIKMLGKEHKHVFVVGDPDQSIYAFRGSHYENNHQFIKDFGAETIVLDQNYRSTNHILNAANNLINKNSQRTNAKNLSSNLGLGFEVSIFQAPTEYNEAYYVMNQIKMLKHEGYTYDQIAILYRNNAISRIFEDALIKEGIPYKIYGGMSFYERKEIKDMLAYVRVVLDPILDFYVKRIINLPRRGIGDVSIKKLEDYAKSSGMSMFDSIDTLDINGKIKQSFKEFKETVVAIQEKMPSMTQLEEIIYAVIDHTGYVDMLKAEQDETSEDRILNIKELASVFKSANYYYEGTFTSKLIQLLDQMSLYTDKDTEKDLDDALILSTIHQVKGLEFKAVFMVVLEEGVFPSEFSQMNPIELEEERRVAYVGITRAKRRLFISYAQKRMLYGQFKMNYPSRFVKEMKALIQKPMIEDEMKGAFLSKGDKVTHQVFGDGVVITVDDDIATIAFPMPHGIKKILESHPSLKKKSLKS